ncbi:MAG: teicoplanin resistance protein VanZ [Sphingomonadaceae bacterium]|nr:teicoplanin resistance protein VanZ [Sphingomonadaceae bacterium]
MTLRRWLFVAVLAFVLAAALVPGNEAPDLGHGDKVNHIAAFVALAVLAAWAWPRARLLAVLAALSALGGAIEGLQALPAIARDAEWADWIADTAAAGVALAAVALVRRAFAR